MMKKNLGIYSVSQISIGARRLYFIEWNFLIEMLEFIWIFSNEFFAVIRFWM